MVAGQNLSIMEAAYKGSTIRFGNHITLKPWKTAINVRGRRKNLPYGKKREIAEKFGGSILSRKSSREKDGVMCAKKSEDSQFSET